MLSNDQVHGALAELCAAFGRPFGADDTVMVQAWRRALHDCEPDEVREAVLFLAKDGTRFPPPKLVRDRAFSIRRRRLAVAQSQRLAAEPDAPLPFCSRCQAWTLIEDEWGRMRPRHADNCPGLHPADLEVQRRALASEGHMRRLASLAATEPLTPPDHA